jgi:hypothetical protein
MLKSYLSVLWRYSAPCYTTSPHRLIPPPIKRSRILVSDGVVILISVKLYLWLLNVWLRCLWLRVLAGKFPFPDILRLEQKVALCAATVKMLLSQRTSGFSLPAFTSDLSFLSNCFTLYLERTSSIFSYSRLQDRLRPFASKDSKHRPYWLLLPADALLAGHLC